MYFQASKLLKLAFLSSLTRKYVLLKGFYHNFSTKKASALGGFAPWAHNLITSLIGETFYLTCSCSFTNLPDDKENFCPLDPRGSFAPQKDLPWRRPCIHFFFRDRVDVVCYKCSQTVLITNLGICFLASSSDDTPNPGRSLVFEAAGYHSHKRTFETHPKHIFFRYVNKPKMCIFACIFLNFSVMSFTKSVNMTKNTPFFPILHIFATLNDVRAYIAWSWKQSEVIFLRGWYPSSNTSAPPLKKKIAP